MTQEERIFDEELYSLRKKISESKKEFDDVAYIYRYGADLIFEMLDEYLRSEFLKKVQNYSDDNTHLSSLYNNIKIIGDRREIMKTKLALLKNLNQQTANFIVSFFEINVKNNFLKYFKNISDYKIKLNDNKIKSKKINKNVNLNINLPTIFTGCFIGENSLMNLRKKFLNLEDECNMNHFSRIFPMIRVKDFTSILQQQGFKQIITTIDTINVEYSNFYKLLKDLSLMGESNILIRRSNFSISKVLYKKIIEDYEKFYEKFDIILFFAKK